MPPSLSMAPGSPTATIPARPSMQRSHSLRAPIICDGPTPPSLLESPLLSIINPAMRSPTATPGSWLAPRGPASDTSSVRSSSSRASYQSSSSSMSGSSAASSSSGGSHRKRPSFGGDPTALIGVATTHVKPWQDNPVNRTPPEPTSPFKAFFSNDDPLKILDTVPAPQTGRQRAGTTSTGTSTQYALPVPTTSHPPSSYPHAPLNHQKDRTPLNGYAHPMDHGLAKHQSHQRTNLQ